MKLYFCFVGILVTQRVPNPEEEIDGILEIEEEVKENGIDLG